MPNIKSAKKRLKQTIVRRQRNRSAKRAIRTECKKVIDAAKAGNADLAEAELRTAAKHVIHRNAAARTKSRLSAKVKAAKGKLSV